MTRTARRLALCGLVALLPAAAFAQPVPLTLADATARALERLPEVAIQRDAITIAAQGETRAEAAYDSVLRIDSRVRTRTDPINTLFVGAPEGALAPRTNSVQGSVAWSRLFESGATVTGTASTSLETHQWPLLPAHARLLHGCRRGSAATAAGRPATWIRSGAR